MYLSRCLLGFTKRRRNPLQDRPHWPTLNPHFGDVAILHFAFCREYATIAVLLLHSTLAHAFGSAFKGVFFRHAVYCR